MKLSAVSEVVTREEIDKCILSRIGNPADNVLVTFYTGCVLYSLGVYTPAIGVSGQGVAYCFMIYGARNGQGTGMYLE